MIPDYTKGYFSQEGNWIQCDSSGNEIGIFDDNNVFISWKCEPELTVIPKEQWIPSSGDLPLIKTFSELRSINPPLPEKIIDGLLYKGHKMLLQGPSKAGKSFALISLAIALAEGKEWMGFNCKKTKVLYINMELDEPFANRRIEDIYKAKFWEVNNGDNIKIWNLMGHAKPLDILKEQIISEIDGLNVDIIIIDPIYKVITGDENSAKDMSDFMNILDNLSDETKASIVFCHHHSKGSQSGKKSIDRGSGSGVLGRSPDAILDLTEIGMVEGAYKLTGTMRYHKSLEGKYLWFKYPIHVEDEAGIKEAIAEALRKQQDTKPRLTDEEKEKNKALRNEKRANENIIKLDLAFDEIVRERKIPTVKNLADILGSKPETIRKWISDERFYIRDEKSVLHRVDIN
jgi:RecA-family ATPase